ncbi:hypothetical protein PS030_54530, partial [Shigella sonnei]|nr:hypothetical protein [Shigella sonnei]
VEIKNVNAEAFQFSSSDASTEKLKSLGIHVFDLNEVDSLGIYVEIKNVNAEAFQFSSSDASTEKLKS